MLRLLSAEFLLDSRPNGGDVVLLRSIWVTFVLLLLLLPFKAFFAEGTVLEFSLEQLKDDLGKMIPWGGAIFAGAYVALYARFSAQWSYLATLYNQLMATSVAMPAGKIEDNEYLRIWRAGFIEDAQDLHLAGKSMFRAMIVGLMSDEAVTEEFVNSVDNGEMRLRKLEEDLGFRASRRCPACLSCTNRAVPTPMPVAEKGTIHGTLPPLVTGFIELFLKRRE
ncbi:hypothetical protein [Stenotrophomonas maltophilia]|uniref:hypothetical protein n=1 Tax=Stenotrophomonas maltophilia TaxID=40324 RepID=UPI0015C54A37|nr:hypothetical protein [Stenotrophomonas maltophilia]